jgi:hypothetical protein
MANLFVTTLGCSLFSFAAGYFGFKIRTRWCPKQGITLRCPECAAAVVTAPLARLTADG